MTNYSGTNEPETNAGVPGGKTDKSGDTLRHHSATLKDDVKMMKEDVQEFGHDAAAAARDAKTIMREEVERMAAMAQERGEAAERAFASFRRNVKKHPTAAVLATLGVGIMIGRMLGKR